MNGTPCSTAEAVESATTGEGSADSASRRRWDRIRRDESGIAVVWLTMFLMVLIGFAALAVDIGHGYEVAQQAQNAADAAALAGTIYLPGDATTAISTAQSVAAANGFPSSVASITAAQQQQPTQLKVTVTEDVPTWFAKAIGFKSMHVSRTAVADYDQPVAMGSPANTFGNQPDCSAPCTTGSSNPQFWANVAGAASPKGNGDQFQSNYCAGGFDNCPNGGTNTDYNPTGYVYAVTNTSANSKVAIDVFDPAFFNVGDHCDDNNVPAGAGTQASNLAALYTDSGKNPRYASGGASSYCTGDQYFSPKGDDKAAVAPVWTSYRVYAPDSTPFTLSDNQLLCKVDFPGYVTDLDAMWKAEGGAGKGASGPLHSQFRQWVNICTINGASTGSYLVQVRTNAKADGSAAPVGSGHNRFSMRASLNGSLNSSALSIAAQANMSIYANAAGASTSFYLARILPGAAGRRLTITFFDVGDVSGGNGGTLKVIPPGDSNVVGGAFSGCQYTPPPGNSTGPPWGTWVDTAGDCSVSVKSSDWNGQVVQWSIPIPPGYTCGFADPTKCWFTLSDSFPGATVQDTTTWSASLDGNPVRIVK